ncbi:hypothetical protein PRUB_b1335 [Pseudoalteromonas rubra]|uniref:Uncharacterized protein n=1 Tax=Pseudoalteromonas rubra TaxID=43658 RepID=A0A8T0C253_9GAMM|nr:hypothetical protein PRUB_b1335 [Pseudoalteromonas rubra]
MPESFDCSLKRLNKLFALSDQSGAVKTMPIYWDTPVVSARF